MISDWVSGTRDGVKSIHAGLNIETPFRNVRARTSKTALGHSDIDWNDIDRLAIPVVAVQIHHHASEEASIVDRKAFSVRNTEHSPDR